MKFPSFPKLFKRKGESSIITKRQEFVVVSILLTLGLIVTQLVPDYRYAFAIVLSVFAYILSAIVLRNDLKGREYITLLTLPAFFTLAVTLFFFLLPLRWISRIPVALLYVVGMYALLLTENIYNVAANRTIALLRAAHTVGFLITLITYFLLLSTIFAFRFHAIPTMVLTGVVSFLLSYQILWSIELQEGKSPRLRHLTVILTLIFTQFSWILSFWSVKTTMKALLLTTVFYSLAGIAQQYLAERLYKKTILEFASVTIVITIIFLLTTNWRGTF